MAAYLCLCISICACAQAFVFSCSKWDYNDGGYVFAVETSVPSPPPLPPPSPPLPPPSPPPPPPSPSPPPYPPQSFIAITEFPYRDAGSTVGAQTGEGASAEHDVSAVFPDRSGQLQLSCMHADQHAPHHHHLKPAGHTNIGRCTIHIYRYIYIYIWLYTCII